MRIIIIEDDDNQSDKLIRDIPKEIPNAQIYLYKTEHSFRSQIERVKEWKPDLFLIDIMLRWTNPSPDMPEAPDEVIEEGFYVAGFRCKRDILENSYLKNLPIILFTVLDKEDLKDKLSNLPRNISYISKDNLTSVLCDHIKRVVIE